MKKVLNATLLGLVVTSNAIHAEPYCTKLLEPKALPKKYQKKAPILSDSEYGWIITNDQLKSDFPFDDEAHFLMSEIAKVFKDRNIQLVIAVPPPRPLFMNVEIPDYEREKAAEAFQSYLDKISQTGVRVPNLLTAMQSNLGQEAYFKRDTHWTTKGAAFAALDLVHQLNLGDAPQVAFQGLSFDETYEEKGSLTAIVNSVCSIKPEMERVPAASFVAKGDANALLSTADAKTHKIALAGTSFSNRYGRDVYRFSNALAYAFDAEVTNYSVSGGGAVSAMETLILGADFQKGVFQTVIWEVPYTQDLADTSTLRQILGALRSLGISEQRDIFDGRVGKDWFSISKSLSIGQNFSVMVQADSSELGQVDLEVYDQNNQKIRTKIRKSKRVPKSRQSDTWWTSFEGKGVTSIQKIKIRLKNAKSEHGVKLTIVN